MGEWISLSGLSRFLNHWALDPLQVTKRCMQRYRERMKQAVQAERDHLRAERYKRKECPKGTVATGYLALDDLVHIKPKGRKISSLGRHYSNTEQPVVVGHCLLTGLYVLLGQRSPLTPRLYPQKRTARMQISHFRARLTWLMNKSSSLNQ